jgi:hydrogenase maturation protease
MVQPRVLVAGIGNIFLGDDAFGVEVVQALMHRRLPGQVKVVDFGIRGFDLTYALLDGYDVAILVDAISRGEKPGTLYVIEPDLNELDDLDEQEMMIETHAMNPMKVLCMVQSMGGEFKRVLVVGCEPETFGGEEGSMGLSEPVQAAVAEAIKMIESLVIDIANENPKEQTQ